jgi:hypothetical protein
MHLNIVEGLSSKLKDNNRNIVDTAARDNSINCNKFQNESFPAFKCVNLSMEAGGND